MLPLDVILEIMKELDWYSLLNVRQVSHRILPGYITTSKYILVL